MESFDLERAKEAGRRYETEVTSSGMEEQENLEAHVPSFGGVAAVPARELKPATGNRRRYLAETSTREKAKATVIEAEAKAGGTQSDTLRALASERIIGSNDLVDLDYLELAIAVSRAVARIRVGPSLGTGSLVAPRIIMTNNHVIKSAAEGSTAVAQFDYQMNTSGVILPVHEYALDPGLFFFTDKDLDVTLIGVSPTSGSGRPLSDYPWLRLIELPGKVEKGDPVNVIQHPRGGTKQVALRNNVVIEVPDGKPTFLFYTTDTEPGSSGSPCFNDQWDVVALHHAGVPRMSGSRILKKDGKPFREGVDDPATIEWIANEGARISAVTAALKQAQLSTREAELRAQMFELKAPNPVELSREARSGGAPRVIVPPEVKRPETPANPGAITFSVPLNITISLGAVSTPPVVAVTPTADPVAIVPPLAADKVIAVTDAEEAVVIDPKWENRDGYAVNFLGPNIPLPKLSAKMQADSVEVPPQYRKGNDKFNFHYHHYSLAMNRKRRFAWYSAANIDGNRVPKIPKRSNDRWFIDPRIDPDVKNPTVQCGEELYKTAKTDRGHLTRYLDVAWGTTAEAVRATNDTFHFSNCCLQLSGFNQGKDRWQGIEQYLLENKARKEKRQMCVFTGPIFKRNDNVYRNEFMDYSVRVPLRFWKVCVLERVDGTLSATAFVLDQEDITSLPGFEEKFDVGAAQVTLADLEKRTGLDFGSLKQHDHFAATGAVGALEIASAEGKQQIKPIEEFSDIVV